MKAQTKSVEDSRYVEIRLKHMLEHLFVLEVYIHLPYALRANSIISQVLPTCLAPLIINGLRLARAFHSYSSLIASLSILPKALIFGAKDTKNHYNKHTFRP